MPLATIPVTVPWATTAEMNANTTRWVDIIIKGVTRCVSEYDSTRLRKYEGDASRSPAERILLYIQSAKRCTLTFPSSGWWKKIQDRHYPSRKKRPLSTQSARLKYIRDAWSWIYKLSLICSVLWPILTPPIELKNFGMSSSLDRDNDGETADDKACW
jgi:hypothetical protein